jgi:NADH-quinone oxidoreductase subunit L
VDLIWLLPLLPAAGAAVNAIVGIRWFSRRVAAAVACSVMAAATVVAVVAFAGLLGDPDRLHEVTLGRWIPPIPLHTESGPGTLEAAWTFRLDPLAAMMSLIVTGIGLLIHVYSVAYMQEEPRGAYARFFAYLNLFCALMLVLVLGGNFLVMFVGWEGVGLCSYLLIGYWYEKKSAADAGRKAFVVNRIGDWGFILGIAYVYAVFGTLDFREVAAKAAEMPVETAGFGALSAIALLLFVGATGKSAQIPLYVWLPDAMEGPTPVSALIHAATMVTAGVYMVGRNAVLFSHAPLVLEIVAIVGVLTALVAASIGLVQPDIKRVLAYSTVSQLGYMFLAMGVGAFAAGAFHLMTHAFFKALLFLGSGAVIHAMAGEQDMHRMGGLRQYMPVTYTTMLVGTLAIAGIPPLAGFFSKDEILLQAFLHNRLLWALGVATAFMTAFYMYRLIALTFLGTYRGPAWAPAGAPAEALAHGVAHPADPHAHGQAHRPDHEVTHGPAHAVPAAAGHAHVWHGPHEAPPLMTRPLLVLAFGAIVAGFVGVPAALGGRNAIEHFLHPSFTAEPAHPAPGAAEAPAQDTHAPVAADTAAPAGGHHVSRGLALGLMLVSVLVAAAGLWLARFVYVRRPGLADRLATRWPALYRWLLGKYYVDELYEATVVRATYGSARGLWRFDEGVIDGAVDGSGLATRVSAWFSHMFDKYVVDGLVNLTGWATGESSFTFRRFQTGLVQNYALLMLFGVFTLLTMYLLAR